MKSIRLTGFVCVEDLKDLDDALADGEVGRVESFKVVNRKDWMDKRQLRRLRRIEKEQYRKE